MRIAFVHSFYSSRQPSGENLVVEAEVAALRKADCEVEVFAAHTDESEVKLLYPVRAGLRVASGRGKSPIKAIRNWGPDVVHVHNLFPNFGRRWVEDLDVPLVHTLHNYRPLCANGLLLRMGKVCSLCPDEDRWAGLRYACYRGSRLATAPIAWANRKGPMVDPLIRRADRLVVLSERQRALYEGAGVPPEKMIIGPNFLLDELDPGASDDACRGGWLFVGRLSVEKGIEELLEQWPEAKDLTIIGDGPIRAEVERLAAKRGAKVVGALSRKVVIESMRGAVGLVYPSLGYETFGLVYLEALATGTPVLAFEPNVVADAVRSDGTGSVGARNEVAVAEALHRVEAQSGELEGRQRCRQVFEDKYSEGCYRRRALELYGSLVSST